MSTQTLKTTSDLLQDLRALRVAVFHPQDQDGEMLTHQLDSIGCKVEVFWPPRPELPEYTDVVFLSIRTDVTALDYKWCTADQAPPIIAVVTSENPTIVNAVLRIGAKGIIASPVRPFGLLSSLVIARQFSKEIEENRKRIKRLEGKVSGIAKVYEAKKLLMDTRKILEEEAYCIIRDQAKSKRVEIEVIAEAIIYAQGLLAPKHII